MWNPNFEKFFYGKMTEKTGLQEQKAERWVRTGESIELNLNIDHQEPSSTRPGHIFLVDQGTAAEPVKKEFKLEFNRKTVQKLSRAIEELNLSQGDAAVLVGISKVYLHKLLNGGAEQPSEAIKERIYNFLFLHRLLKENLSKAYMIRAALHKPHPAFGGKTALEFCESLGDEGPYSIVGIFARIFE